LIAAESGAAASGRWFTLAEAWDLALPAPLRKLLFASVD
jgi:hypothetical protein